MRGHDGTHGRRGDVTTAPTIIFDHLPEAIVINCPERSILPRHVETSSVRDWMPFEFTTRLRQGTAAPFCDDPHNRGG